MAVDAPDTAPDVEIKAQIQALRSQTGKLSLMLLGGSYVHGTVGMMHKNVISFRVEGDIATTEFEIPYGRILGVGVYAASKF